MNLFFRKKEKMQKSKIIAQGDQIISQAILFLYFYWIIKGDDSNDQ